MALGLFLTKNEKIIKGIGKAQKKKLSDGDICPRCGCAAMKAGYSFNTYFPPLKVYICTACGVDVAVTKKTLDENRDYSDWACVSGSASAYSDVDRFEGESRFRAGDRVYDTSCMWCGLIIEELDSKIYSVLYDGDALGAVEFAKDKELLFEFSEESLATIKERFVPGGHVLVLKYGGNKLNDVDGKEGTIAYVGNDGSIHIKTVDKKTIVLHPERDIFSYHSPKTTTK